MAFTITAERPVASRPITDELRQVMAAFRQSIEQGSVEGKAGWVGAPITDEDMTDVATVDELRKMVTRAAQEEGMGYRFRVNANGNPVFWAVNLTESVYATCDVCNNQVRVTSKNTLNSHGPRDKRCPGSGAEVQPGDEAK